MPPLEAGTPRCDFSVNGRKAAQPQQQQQRKKLRHAPMRGAGTTSFFIVAFHKQFQLIGSQWAVVQKEFCHRHVDGSPLFSPNVEACEFSPPLLRCWYRL
ncbi:exo-alpha-sialidase [Trypanosoma cruzi]|nr:exo-alpha-sialidase [Trypanosoma cruzi]